MAVDTGDKLLAEIAKRKWISIPVRLAEGLLGKFSGLSSQLDVSLAQALNRQRIANVAIFLEECDRVFPPDIKLEQLEREEFLRSYDLIADALRFIRNRDKLKFFAWLLKNALTITAPQERDDNEQLIRVFDDLSNRELELLALIAGYDQKYPLYSGDNPNNKGTHDHHKTWLPFRDDLMKRYGMTHKDYEDAMIRMNRSGLCVFPVRQENDMSPFYPHLTTLFYRFRKIIEIRDLK